MQFQQQQQQFLRQDVEVAVKQAAVRREELCVLVMKTEEEVAITIAKREAEIIRNPEAAVDADAACVQREELIRTGFDERTSGCSERAEGEGNMVGGGEEGAGGECEEGAAAKCTNHNNRTMVGRLGTGHANGRQEHTIATMGARVPCW